MANTSTIKNVEQFVRTWLCEKYSFPKFEELKVFVSEKRGFNFDAVSKNNGGTIVAAILCNRPKTRTKRVNTGGHRKADSDILKLILLPEDTKKIMVFTNYGFCQSVKKRWTGTVIEERIAFKYCELPLPLQTELDLVLDKTSQEQRAAGDS